MRYIIIGDVHGMLVELQALIEKVELRPDDCIVFVGDLVDKGPSPEGVVRYVKALSEDYDVVVVEGNHEEKHRRFRKSQNMEMKGAEEISRVYDSLTEEERSFMAGFVPFHRIKAHGLPDCPRRDHRRHEAFPGDGRRDLRTLQ